MDLSKDERYLGGAIGLTLQRGSELSYCAPGAYSVPAHNTKSANGEPFVGAIVYESVVEPGAVYLAFEDGLMLPSDWTNGGKTDGDFNDYVLRASSCLTVDASGGAGGAGGGGDGPLGAAGDGGGEMGGSSGGGDAGAETGGAPSSGGSASAGDHGVEPQAGGESLGSSGAGGAGESTSTQGESSGCGCRTR